MLKRAVGIRAIFAILSGVVADGGPPPEGKNEVKVRAFVNSCAKKLRSTLTKAAAVDFSDTFFEASARGQTRIANVFRLANQLVTIEQMPEGDRADYSRLLRSISRGR